MVNGRSQKLSGGIMLSALLLIAVVSVLFYATLENHRQAVIFTAQTERLYIARTMTQLFIAQHRQLPPDKRPESGRLKFNCGELTFQGKTEVRVIVYQPNDKHIFTLPKETFAVAEK